MSKPITNGKKALSTKPRPANPFAAPDFFSNKLAIPEGIKADLEANGQEGRWISYKKFIENGNSHDKGWAIYKAPKRAEPGSEVLEIGSTVDGIIRRGDSVLACRSKVNSQKHRDWLKNRAELQATGFQKTKADELRQSAREAGMAVHEGYDENDEE